MATWLSVATSKTNPDLVGLVTLQSNVYCFRKRRAMQDWGTPSRSSSRSAGEGLTSRRAALMHVQNEYFDVDNDAIIYRKSVHPDKSFWGTLYNRKRSHWVFWTTTFPGGLLEETVLTGHVYGEDIAILASFTYPGGVIHNSGQPRQKITQLTGLWCYELV